jgi:hypothetical protein
MHGVIVGDQMQGRALGNLAVNETEEPEPFLGPVARQIGGEERALGHIQGGKERGRALAFVLVRHRAAAPGLEEQAWLGAIQCVAWIWLFSSTHRIMVCSGGGRQRPTTSSSLSWKCGSWLSVTARTR